MKTLLIFASMMVVLFLAAPNEVEAQKTRSAGCTFCGVWDSEPNGMFRHYYKIDERRGKFELSGPEFRTFVPLNLLDGKLVGIWEVKGEGAKRFTLELLSGSELRYTFGGTSKKWVKTQATDSTKRSAASPGQVTKDGKRNTPTESNLGMPLTQTLEATVTGYDGTKYWSGFRMEADGREYSFVAEYNAGQGTNPSVAGGTCCEKGMRIRVTYIPHKDQSNLLEVTHIVILR